MESNLISLQKMTNESPKIISLEDKATNTFAKAIANTFNSFFCSARSSVKKVIFI